MGGAGRGSVTRQRGPGGARQCRPLPTVRHPHTGGDPSLAAAATARRSGSSPTPEDSPSEAVTCHWVPHLSHIARHSSRETQHRRGTLQRLTAGIADRPYTAASPCLCSVFSIVREAGPLSLRLSDCKPQNVYRRLPKLTQYIFRSTQCGVNAACGVLSQSITHTFPNQPLNSEIPTSNLNITK